MSVNKAHSGMLSETIGVVKTRPVFHNWVRACSVFCFVSVTATAPHIAGLLSRALELKGPTTQLNTTIYSNIGYFSLIISRIEVFPVKQFVHQERPDTDSTWPVIL